MKLLRAKVDKLHKYISVELIFNTDLSIVTGINGSGKTQILKLIDAVLWLKIDYLDSVYFNFFELDFESENKKFEIKIEKKKGVISFSVNNDEIILGTRESQQLLFDNKYNVKDNFFHLLKRNIESNKMSIFNIFHKIKPPVFLGLNRIVENEDYEIERVSLRGRSVQWRNEKNDIIKNDYMFNSINQCKRLISEEFNLIKKYEDTQDNILRNKFISSSFDYLEGDFVSSRDLANKFKYVFERKNSIIEELDKININDSNMKIQINRFFEKMNNLKTYVDNGNEDKIALELLLNLSQIERVSNIISIIDDHKKIMDIKRSKIISFIDSVNRFFLSSNKKIMINNLGHIFVIVDGKHRVELENLSSGEMQLISIVSNMVFCKNNNKDLVVIIDEPEISLHIKWQEIFIEVMDGIRKEAQLILATHSPDIIGEKIDYCVPIVNKFSV